MKAKTRSLANFRKASERCDYLDIDLLSLKCKPQQDIVDSELEKIMKKKNIEILVDNDMCQTHEISKEKEINLMVDDILDSHLFKTAAKTPKATSLNYLQRIAKENNFKPDVVTIEPKTTKSSKMVKEILSNWTNHRFCNKLPTDNFITKAEKNKISTAQRNYHRETESLIPKVSNFTLKTISRDSQVHTQRELNINKRKLSLSEKSKQIFENVFETRLSKDPFFNTSESGIIKQGITSSASVTSGINNKRNSILNNMIDNDDLSHLKKIKQTFKMNAYFYPSINKPK